MDDRARKIFDEAYATLQRTADVTVEHRDDSGDYWQRPKSKPEPASVQRLTDAETLRWSNYIDAKIAAAVDLAMAEHKMLADARQEAVGKALGQVRAQLRSEIVEQVGQLRADLTIEKAHAGDSARVIDLPALSLRSERRA